jgi:hypothetical protein
MKLKIEVTNPERIMIITALMADALNCTRLGLKEDAESLAKLVNRISNIDAANDGPEVKILSSNSMVLRMRQRLLMAFLSAFDNSRGEPCR